MVNPIARSLPVALAVMSALGLRLSAPERAWAQSIDPLWDAYKIYGASPNPTLVTPFSLRDGIALTNHTSAQLEMFSTPVELRTGTSTGFPIADAVTHYSWWKITAPAVPLATVSVETEFGFTPLFLQQPTHLLEPALMNQPGLIPAKNHYKCYSCFGPLLNLAVVLTDGFKSYSAVLTAPVYFCDPAEKVSAGAVFPIADATQDLVCYQIQAPDPNPHAVTVTDPFVRNLGVLLNPGQFVCLPAVNQPITPTARSTWGRVKQLYR